MLIFKVVAPLNGGEFTAGTAIVNIIPNDLAKLAGAGRRIKVLKQPRIKSHERKDTNYYSCLVPNLCSTLWP